MKLTIIKIAFDPPLTASCKALIKISVHNEMRNTDDNSTKQYSVDTIISDEEIMNSLSKEDRMVFAEFEKQEIEYVELIS